jgi:hypothetical protein
MWDMGNLRLFFDMFPRVYDGMLMNDDLRNE